MWLFTFDLGRLLSLFSQWTEDSSQLFSQAVENKTKNANCHVEIAGNYMEEHPVRKASRNGLTKDSLASPSLERVLKYHKNPLIKMV